MLTKKQVSLFKRMLDWEANNWLTLRFKAGKPRGYVTPTRLEQAQWALECRAKFKRDMLTNSERGAYEAHVFHADVKAGRFKVGDAYGMYVKDSGEDERGCIDPITGSRMYTGLYRYGSRFGCDPPGVVGNLVTLTGDVLLPIREWHRTHNGRRIFIEAFDESGGRWTGSGDGEGMIVTMRLKSMPERKAKRITRAGNQPKQITQKVKNNEQP